MIGLGVAKRWNPCPDMSYLLSSELRASGFGVQKFGMTQWTGFGDVVWGVGIRDRYYGPTT